MTVRGWHRDFMRPAYWKLAEWEYDPERTERELAYLDTRVPPASRVVDLGCGLGRHSVGLAARGRRVVGVDCRVDVLHAAGERARRQEVDGVGFLAADLFVGLPLADASVDAAVCIQSFGWGSERDQLGLLHTARRVLTRDGVLVLDVTNVAWILARYTPAAEVTADGVRYRLNRVYDVLSGRSRGSTVPSQPPGEPITHDIRLYTPPEVRLLLERAGFEVVATDADFTPGRRPSLEARYLQYVARPARAVTARLAVHLHDASVERLAPRSVPPRLDLRTIVEEPELHARPLAALWRDTVSDADGFSVARDYAVDDPYGGRRLAAALSTADCPVGEGNVTAGAGVSGLLAAFGELASGGAVVTHSLAHPDLTRWAAVRGSPVITAPGPVEDLADALAAPAVGQRGPVAMVSVDRPTSRGEVLSLASVARLAAVCRSVGALLVVDESYAAYLDPAESSGPTAVRTPGLVVVQGMSKGYGLGGLRVGWALADLVTTARVRSVVPPLQVSTMSLRVATRILEGPDVLGPLRSAVVARKPAFGRLLELAGIRPGVGHPAVPWVTVRRPDAVRLARAGIAGKPTTAEASLWRLTVPLSTERFALAERLLGGLAEEVTGG